MTMTRMQATSEAMRLAGEGKSYATIADHLKAKGYISVKTGRPLSTAGVNQMVLDSGHRVRGKYKVKAKKAPATTQAAVRAKKAPATTQIDRLTAVKSILNVSSMLADERIAFALLMIG